MDDTIHPSGHLMEINSCSYLLWFKSTTSKIPYYFKDYPLFKHFSVIKCRQYFRYEEHRMWGCQQDSNSEQGPVALLQTT